MELLAKKFMCNVRFQAARLAIRCETMGKHLLQGEDEDGLLHMYSDLERSGVAAAIHRLIYPTSKRATEADKLRALRRYFLSESITKMANCVVGELGKVNIGLGMVGTQSSDCAEIPHTIFPLAATLVSCSIFSSNKRQTSGMLIHRLPCQILEEIMVVKNSRDQPNGRSGLYRNFIGFSKSDRTTYESLCTVWTESIYLNPNSPDPPIEDLVLRIRHNQEVARAVRGYRDAQRRENTWQPPLPSTLNQPPPSYSSVSQPENQRFISIFASIFQ